ALHNQPSECGDPAWSYWMDEAQANEQVGYCYMRMEDWSQAQNHFRASLRPQADPPGRETALRQALLATTYARQGNPEHACQVGERAVDSLADSVDSDRCVTHVRRLQNALTPYRKVGVVRNFNERVAQLFGASTCPVKAPGDGGHDLVSWPWVA